MNMLVINKQLALEVSISEQQVRSFISLYDDGNTVPFIARYRTEATGGLDDKQLRLLETRLVYLRELELRRQSILKTLTETDKLTPALAAQIKTLSSKAELELLYLPYKSKRINKAAIAEAAGLATLADKLWFQADADSHKLARAYLSEAFPVCEDVLSGVLELMFERLVTDINLVKKLKDQVLKKGQFSVKVVKGKEPLAIKFKDYFAYNEPIKRIQSHRLLAILRGKSEGYLRLKIEADPQHSALQTSSCESLIAQHLGFNLHSMVITSWRAEVIKKAWKSKLLPMLETQIINELKEKAYDEAIALFATNLHDLLMAAPAGRKVVLGLDPGFKSGCKVAIIDSTGKYLASETIYPHQPQKQYSSALQRVIALINEYHVDLVAIGNGTASRESEQFIRDCLDGCERDIKHLIVSEAGASVYSASELASKEFPDLAVSIRGAVSIARRLQDPLAELVKIDAKAIGVGLYQHDINQTKLSQRLQAVVEDCVNAVGIDLNSASAPLLSFIAGLNNSIAENIVAYRESNGLFESREMLKKVPRLGAKAFQQAAGFLRVSEAKNQLDNSAVHPESYYIVHKMAQQLGITVSALLKQTARLTEIDNNILVDQQFGPRSIEMIIAELNKPSRDPRPEFTTISYSEGVKSLIDLSIGMQLQGVITNVTNFGAFVDIGVHQDGLVHISHLADKFVSDPTQIVKTGQIVSVKVLEVDIERKRIALSMRND